ncbi:MAG: glutamine-hydrolyzing carbamoyl-phosphate synthase small subunit [Deltaproteobacteria bacterium]|nr:glutamine-hydrolyzing carbamoyl-phosphate synthase small subunit [Deltaproteobacteria bacterium]
MDGILVLEDGRWFRGHRFGAREVASGEVVFNTSMQGYQEILTDPSYVGQVVVLTSSHVGNYGVNRDDPESGRVCASGLVVRDHHAHPSNWRSDRSLDDELRDHGVPGLGGVDTRALTLHLRDHGAQRGVIADWPADSDLALGGWARQLDASPDLAGLVARARKAPSMTGRNLAREVTCRAPWTAGEATARWHVVCIDFGIKRNIVRQLLARGCRVTVVPADTGPDEVLALRPDGVVLSNGPGDPEPVTTAQHTIRALLGRVPMFGICLGHQLLALALGGRTYKLPFGHRGGNHPVRDLETGRVEITAQNHGFAVLASSLDGRQVTVTHVNLNDDTVEGLRHRHLAAFSVQFHPEGAPGPHDSHHLFARFVQQMARFAGAR